MLQPKSVLITGAGSGIGLATAEAFLTEGWHVIAVGRRLELLKALEEKSPGHVLPLVCDITKSDSINKMAAELAKHEGFNSALCAVVNNAGIFIRKSFEKTTDTEWEQLFETNLMGAVKLTRKFLPQIKKNRGVVINVSSSLGVKPIPETSAYSALKSAMINWTQCLALELAPSGARANCVCPGIVDTPIHGFHSQSAAEKLPLQNLQPLGRLGQPQDVAHGILALAGRGSEWITGASLTIDGGITLAGS